MAGEFHVSRRAVIRTATDGDVADIERIVAAAYAPYVSRIGREPAPMTVDYLRAVSDTDHVHVLVKDDETVGVLVMVPESDHVFVDSVAVSGGHQGRGYGRALLEYAEQRARDLRLPRVRLYTNAAMTENLALYPHLGYRETRRGYEDGFHRVFFERSVDLP
ncbi:GNAT family N-acetyltransferase [Mycolicibacterium sp. BiH015]|uniref:GNAT family N-acetyltransferase n=1 Tax=Mycolicibacterium sp. BiH015 TaxID=3018808 RepID=UPI0022E873D4|nr:GNAT family N-acetyltransferase [Mycolicibacterium sp. BiH015]MDA2892643.1 GNAT family N-acetyltransferase [Mycolicibacterium sp. BiH015]